MESSAAEDKSKEQQSQGEQRPEQSSKDRAWMEEEATQEQKFSRYWNIIEQKLKDREQPQETILHYKQLLAASQHDAQIDRAIGSIYGAMVGDALGAFCQFQHSMHDETVKEAMQMNGGGTFGCEAGQFTDDSELAAHLLNGLARFQEDRPLAQQANSLVCCIGLQYLKWYESEPFDMGNTTRCGITAIYDCQEQMREGTDPTTPTAHYSFLSPLFSVINSRNLNSMANGSLMRISPFAFFFALTGEHPSNHKQLIKDQMRLTHPNLNLASAGLCWVEVLTSLIQRSDNSPETFASILNKSMENEEYLIIKEWFVQSLKEKEQAMPGTITMGFAKIAFSYGLRILHYLGQGKETRTDGKMYIDWMSWIIKRAGDTDTNGAIAGGLMGSVTGFWNLPLRYVVRSLKTVTDQRPLEIQDEQKQPKNPSKSKYHTPRRPNFYEPCNVLLSALSMTERCHKYRMNSSGKE